MYLQLWRLFPLKPIHCNGNPGDRSSEEANPICKVCLLAQIRLWSWWRFLRGEEVAFFHAPASVFMFYSCWMAAVAACIAAFQTLVHPSTGHNHTYESVGETLSVQFPQHPAIVIQCCHFLLVSLLGVPLKEQRHLQGSPKELKSREWSFRWHLPVHGTSSSKGKVNQLILGRLASQWWKTLSQMNREPFWKWCWATLFLHPLQDKWTHVCNIT